MVVLLELLLLTMSTSCLSNQGNLLTAVCHPYLENKKLEIIVRSWGKYAVMALVTSELVWIMQVVHEQKFIEVFQMKLFCDI